MRDTDEYVAITFHHEPNFVLFYDYKYHRFVTHKVTMYV